MCYFAPFLCVFLARRLKFGLPVVIMGETGCGKSSLIRQLCAVLGAPLRTLNVHGGMEDGDVLHWMRGIVAEAQQVDPCVSGC